MLKDHSSSIDEESRWLLAFNAAAIGVIVALSYRAAAMPMGFRAAGIFFLIGAVAAVVAWTLKPPSAGRLGAAVPVSAALFLLGVTIAFFAV